MLLARVLFACSLLFTLTAAYTTWQVSSNCAGLSNCFTNFSGAIETAAPNDLVNVAAGNWPIFANLVLSGKPLSIVGAGSGSTFVNCTTGWEIDYYYSAYYIQGVTFLGCDRFYVQQASVSLNDVVLDGFLAYPFFVYYGAMKLRSFSVQNSLGYAYGGYSDFHLQNDVTFGNQQKGEIAFQLDASTLKAEGSLTLSCAEVTKVSPLFMAFYLYYSSATILGDLTIQNCPGTPLYMAGSDLDIGGDLTYSNISCTFASYAEYSQLAVYGDYLLTNSRVELNTCYFYEGNSAGFEVFGDFTVQNIQVIDGGQNGLIYFEDYANFIVHGNTLFTDISYYTSGINGVVGLYSEYSHLKTMGSFTFSNIFFNSSTTGTNEGVMYLEASTWEAIGPVLFENINGQGYAVVFWEKSSMVSSSTFTVTNCQNLIPSYLIYLNSGVWTSYDSVSITNNIAGNSGALFLNDMALNFYGSFSLSNNTGLACGGGLFQFSSGTFGGPVAISSNTAQATTGGKAGGLYLDSFAMTTYGTTTISNNYGGGVFAAQSAWFAEGDLTLSGNVNPWGSGGAVNLFSISSWVTYGNTVISNNKADTSGGGVGLSTESSWRSVGPVTISSNQAQVAGGGVYIPVTSDLWTSQGPVTITGNTAPLGGGVYVGKQAAWANVYYDPAFQSNLAATAGSDIYCDGGFLYSLSKSCNSSSVTCIAPCAFGLIDTFVTLSTPSLIFNNNLGPQWVTAYLSSALSVDLTLPVLISANLASFSDQIVITPGSIDFPAGTTSVAFSVALNTSLSNINVLATVQLLPPLPELLVFLGNSSSVSLAVNLASSDSSQLMRSWVIWCKYGIDVFALLFK